MTMPVDPRLHAIVSRRLMAISQEIAQHLTAMSQEITQALAQSAVSMFETDGAPPIMTSPPEPIVPAALLYDAVTRRWCCPRCRGFSDIRRRAVTAHLRSCVLPAPAAKKHKKPRSTKKKP